MASKKTSTTSTPNKKIAKREISSATTSLQEFPSVTDFTAKEVQPLNTGDSLIAYVHEMSQVKRNRGDTMDYHSFKLQTSANTHRDALLYSLSKRPLLMESELSRTPVKIKNFTFTHDKSKIVINDMTNISTPQQCEYSFQYADIPLPLNTTTVLDVYNNNKEWDMVTVRGKVLSVNQPRAVGSPKKRLKLMEATLADKAGSIPLDLWESNIDQIKEGAVYSFNQVQVRVWSSRKKLSTTIKTTIQPFEEPDLANIEDSHCARDNETTTTMVNEIFSIQKI